MTDWQLNHSFLFEIYYYWKGINFLACQIKKVGEIFFQKFLFLHNLMQIFFPDSNNWKDFLDYSLNYCLQL